MSFLFNKKSFFVLLFLFTIFFNQTSFVFAQEAAAPDQVESQEQGDNLATKAMDAVLGFNSIGMRLAAPFVAIIGVLISGLANIALGIASYIFDNSIEIGVHGISDFANDDAVKSAWKIFRNIANIGIIFALIFIAISTILQRSGYEGKKLLGSVVIAALLMNFSFFLGAVVVDVSNEMALTVYKEIQNITGGDSSGGDNKNLELGSYYMEKTQNAVFATMLITELDENNKKLNEGTVENTKDTSVALIKTFGQKGIIIATSSILGALTSLILAAILAIAAAMIIGRLVAIILLLVVSPIAFASMILPNTKKIADEWWQSIVGHSFYLPAFLLFIYVGVKITELVPDSVSKITSNTESVTASLNFAGIIKEMGSVAMIYSIVIGLFIAALIVAKKVSSGGSAAVGKISSSVTSSIGGIALGAAGLAGRNTIGAGANLAADKFAKSNFATTRAGMAILSGMKGVAKSGFDARESRAFKGVASATGVGGDFKNTFAPQKDGYIGQQDRAKKAIVEASKNLSDDDQKEAKTQAKKEMDKAINSDSYVVEAKKTINELGIDYEAAKAVGDSQQMKRINKLMSDATQNLNTHESRVRDTDEYKELSKILDVKSQREKYAENLKEKRTKIDLVMPSTWLPSAKSIDKKAAGEIIKAMSKEQKQLKDLKNSWKTIKNLMTKVETRQINKTWTTTHKA